MFLGAGVSSVFCTGEVRLFLLPGTKVHLVVTLNLDVFSHILLDC